MSGVSIEQRGAAELRRRLAKTRLPLAPADRQALKAEVSSFVANAKRDGWLPERVIVAVKQMAREAGLRPSSHVALTTLSMVMTEQDQLMIDMVGWCIDEYYRPG